MSWTQQTRADALTSIVVSDSLALAATAYTATNQVSCVVETLASILALKGVTGACRQSKSVASIATGVTTQSLAFPSGNAAGDTLVVIVAGDHNGFGPVGVSCADSQGNAYSQISSDIVGGGFLQLTVFVATASRAGINTVTLTYTNRFTPAPPFSSAFDRPAMAILEYPGGTGSDGYAIAQSATGGLLSVSLTTSKASETLLSITGMSPSCLPPSPVLTGPSGGFPSPPAAWLIVNEPGGTYTNRTSYLHKGPGNQNSWNQELGQRGTATIHLYVAAGDTYQPVRGSQVYLFDQNQSLGFIGPLFSGLIEDITVQYFSNNGDHFVILTCVSFEALLDTVYADVAVSYTNATCGSIVTDLFNRFESGAPIALGTISDGAMLPLFNVSVGQSLSELLGQLATTSQFAWLVDPKTLQLFFGSPSTTAAPFTLNSSAMLWDGQIQIEWTVDGRDKRNRQAVKLSFDAFPKSKEYIVGTGQQNITLSRPVQQVTNAWATPSTSNTATAHFSGQPTAGDVVTIGPANSAWQANHLYGVDGTITINGFVQQISVSGTTGAVQPTFSTVTGQTTVDNTAVWTCLGPSGLAPAGSASTMTYTFVASLDNTQFGQVLIGASLAATVQNLVDAINAAAPYSGTPATAGRGLTFSLPTWENSQINAISVTGTGFTAQEKSAGSGWVSMLTSTGTAFAWSNEFTTGGTSPFGTIQLQVYQAGTSTAAPAVQYTPGSADIRMATPLNVGSALNIEYTRADGAVIQVEDTADVTAEAAIQKGTGKYQLLTDQSNTGLIATSAAAGLQLGQQIIAAFVTAPQKLRFTTYVPGLLPGQTLPVSLTFPRVAGSAPVLNGTWVIQRVEAALVPVTYGIALPWLEGPLYGHYRYTVECVNIQEIASWLDFWKGAGGGGSGGAGGGLPGPGANVPTSGGSTSNAGTALLIEVNGTALSADTAQNEVNFEAGSGITLTDLGAGALQIKASAGVNVQTANYAALAADSGKNIVFNDASPCTLTLPNPAPSSAWNIFVQNIGAGTLTVSRNSLTIDGAAANLTLTTGQGVYIATDGTNYFTERGMVPVVTALSAAGIAGVNYAAGAGTGNAQTAAYSPAVAALTTGLVLLWTPTAANASTTPTFAPNGLTAKTITKAGGSALVANDLTTTAVACAIYDGTNWELQNPQTGGSAGTVTHTGGALTLDQPVFGAGGADIKVGTKSGNTDEVVTQSGAATSGRVLLYDANGNAIASTLQGNTTQVQMAAGAPTTGYALIYDANGNAVPASGPPLTNPMTTKGDVIVAATGGAATRLAVGTDGQVLTAKAAATNGVDWEEPIALTTTGTSGAASLTPGNPYTLNVPQYSGGGGLVLVDPTNGWTAFNTGGMALAPTYASARWQMSSGSGAGVNIQGISKAIPSAPYTRTFRIWPILTQKSYGMAGIGFADGTVGTPGKLVIFSLVSFDPAQGVGGSNAGFLPALNGQNFTNTTTGSTAVALSTGIPISGGFSLGPAWMQLIDDGTNWIWKVSVDGTNYITAITEAHNTFLTATQLVVIVNTNFSSDKNFLTFDSYQ